MAYVVPCQLDRTHYSMQVVLDGLTYTMEFRWNTRDAAWFLDLATEDGTPVASGVRVVVGFPLCARVTGANRLPGVLIARDTSGRGIGPGLADLGDRVKLLYFTRDELLEALP